MYFDDFEVMLTEGKVVQSNNYYPFGLQQNTSWTKAEQTPNAHKFNAATEYNDFTDTYDTPFRQYDPATGRFNGVDALAHMTPTLTPYRFGFNNPVSFNDPTGLSERPVELDDPNLRSGGGGSSIISGADNDFSMIWFSGSMGRVSIGGRDYGNRGHMRSSNIMAFALDIFNAAADGITYLSGNDVQAAYDQWSSLNPGEGFALNYGADGSLSFDTYRHTAGGEMSGYSSTELKESGALLDKGNGLFHYGDDKGAFKVMRSMSESIGVEISALLLDNNSVYIFPWEGNTSSESQNTTWFNWGVYQVKGSFGVQPYTVASIGNEKIRVLAQIHTHPLNIGLSDARVNKHGDPYGDLALAKQFQIPVFVLGPTASYYGAHFQGEKSYKRYWTKTSNILNGSESIRSKAKDILYRQFGL